MIKKEYSIEVDGKIMGAEFNDLADQAHGSVLVSSGDTSVLATVVMSSDAREGTDFFPLTVDYEEKFYAAGKILGSRFMRREGRPSDEAVLSGRVVDRTIRPLFEQHIRKEVQVIITVLSIGEVDPDVLAVNAASLALGTSNIPWNGPVSAIKMGKEKEKDEFIINPSYTFKKESAAELDMLACGKDGKINMIEIGSKEIDEQIIVDALAKASEEIEKIQEWQKKIILEIGKEKKKVQKPELASDTVKLFNEKIRNKIDSAIFSEDDKNGLAQLQKEWTEIVKKETPSENFSLALNLFEEEIDKLVHREAIQNDRRADGRKMNEIRPLFAKAGGFLKTLHGTGIFYRGATHVLSVLTLGGVGDSLLIDGIEVSEKKRFMHHYNFPSFSTGEVGRSGGMNRRAIGHGALAEKALSAVIPEQEKFPYTIRIVSEALASNGSTSMASVCGSTLALMDGGVPIKNPVAGIAMGLMSDGEKYKILTDIQGPEDHYGDMDFKVAGTKDGVNAAQMDVKIGGIPLKILSEVFADAKKARIKILDVIAKEISEPRPEISPYAPKVAITKIKPDQIGLVIGSGGKTVNEIRDITGAEIAIEDDGTVYATGKDGSAEKAIKIIQDMTREYHAGEKFDGTVTRIMDFGAFVKIGYNTEGMVHISEIAPFRVEQIEGLLKEGDVVPVVIKEVDEKGRINLSIKQANPNFIKKQEGASAVKNYSTGEYAQKHREHRKYGGRR